jgi:H+/gluconate symporter-like permease
VQAIAGFMTQQPGARRAMQAGVIGGALVTYGGVGLFVAFFVLAPMAQALFQEANIPRRLMPPAIALGTSTFTMSALPGATAIRNAIAMPFFGTTPFAAPGLGVVASPVMAGFGLWWPGRQEARARALGEGFTTQATEHPMPEIAAAHDTGLLRERATVSQSFYPVEIDHDHISSIMPSFGIGIAPLVNVVGVNFTMNVVVSPRLDASCLAAVRRGATSLGAVGGVWGVCVALGVAIVTLILVDRPRLTALRESVDAGVNVAVLPVLSVSSLVGYGALIAALPAFALVREWALRIGRGPLVSPAVATNPLAALTGSASGGMTIALDALGSTYLQLAAQHHIDPALLHRVGTISSGTLESLPHNRAVVTLLAVCGSTHRESYRDHCDGGYCWGAPVAR